MAGDPRWSESAGLSQARIGAPLNLGYEPKAIARAGGQVGEVADGEGKIFFTTTTWESILVGSSYLRVAVVLGKTSVHACTGMGGAREQGGADYEWWSRSAIIGRHL